MATTDALVREALAVASKRTEGGKGIDDEQVHVERLAYAATEARAARDLLTYAAGVAVQQPDPSVPAMAAAFAGEIGTQAAGTDRGASRRSSASPRIGSTRRSARSSCAR